MIRKIAISILLLCATASAFAQVNDGTLPPSYSNPNSGVTPFDHDSTTHKHHWFDPQKIIFGMGGGLSLGTYSYIELEPRIGYRFTDKLSAGLGLTYIYSSGINTDPYTNINYTYSSSIYGGDVFVHHQIYRNFIGIGQFEVLNAPAYNFDLNTSEFVPTRINVPSLFIGVGYRQPISERSAFMIYMLYNVIYDNNTTSWIYPSPLVFQAGFTF